MKAVIISSMDKASLTREHEMNKNFAVSEEVMVVVDEHIFR